MVGLDCTIRLIGRMDIAFLLNSRSWSTTICLPAQAAASKQRARTVKRQPPQQQRELVDETLQESPRALVGYYPRFIHEPGLEADISLAAHHQHTQHTKDLPQMLLRERGTGRARRRAGDCRHPSGPGVPAVGPAAPVDG